MPTIDTPESPIKRGKPADQKFSREALFARYREITLETDEILNPSKLEKITGIKRRNWNKIQDEIDSINKLRTEGIDVDALKSFPMPNVDETFTLYFPHNPKRLKEVFQSLINLVSRMYEKSISFEKTKEQYQVSLAEKDREIERLNAKLKAANEDAEFHKNKYAEVYAGSVFYEKRQELGIPNNVVIMPKGSKKSMLIDIQKEFEADLLGTDEVDSTKK